jgi:hypothetical protein
MTPWQNNFCEGSGENKGIVNYKPATALDS